MKLVTFNLDNVKSFVTASTITDEMIANHIETCQPNTFSLSVDKDGL